MQAGKMHDITILLTTLSIRSSAGDAKPIRMACKQMRRQ
jgi:hypothetical protein